MRLRGKSVIWISLGAVVGLVVVSVAALTLTRADNTGAVVLSTRSAASVETTTTTVPMTTTTTIPGLIQPAEVVLPALPNGSIGRGSSGDVVKAYQQRFADLHFDPGAVDGMYGPEMVYAVHALQKMIGAPKTGRLGAQEAMTLATLKYPTPLQPNGEANRTEIDVSKQVMTLYENHQVRLITTVSTGSGESYCFNTPRVNPTSRVCEYANTPSGRYTYTEYRDGWDKSPLGQLYNPFYFNGGIAVHGYKDVPTTPESHGCTRIPMHIAEYFHTLVKVRDAVYVFGGSPAKIISSGPARSGTTATTAPPPSATTAPTTTTSEPPTTTTSEPPPTTTTTLADL